MVCCVILYRLYGLYIYIFACAGTSTEADKSDVTEHPRDDKRKPYLCTVCHKRFTRKIHLNEHSKTHTGKNVYPCTQCVKGFSSQSGLYQHMNIHAGKYKCTECGKCCHSRQRLLPSSTQTKSFRRETV